MISSRAVSTFFRVMVPAVVALSSCGVGPFSVQEAPVPDAEPFVPDDPLTLSDQEYLAMIGASAGWGMYRAVVESPIGNLAPRPVTVGVIDSGIDGAHPDLRSVLSSDGVDVVGGVLIRAPSGWPSTLPAIDHGTHVSGLIAAQGNNGEGISGVALNVPRRMVTITAVRALEQDPDKPKSRTGDLLDLFQALYYLADGIPGVDGPADLAVVNMSLGLNGEPTGDLSLLLRMAMQAVAARDVVLVAAAGNDGQLDGVDWPASLPEVIAVGSVDISSSTAAAAGLIQRSWFSDRGMEVELVAPGADPSAGEGGGIVSTWPVGLTDEPYEAQSGTSMATPLVAGTVALMRSMNPLLTAADVRAILQETAVDAGEPGRDATFGYGLVRVDRAVRRAASVPYGRYPAATAVVTARDVAATFTRLRAAGRADPPRYRDAEEGDFLPEAMVFVSDVHGPDDVWAAAGVTGRRIVAIDGGAFYRVELDGTSDPAGTFLALRDHADVDVVVQNRTLRFADLSFAQPAK